MKISISQNNLMKLNTIPLKSLPSPLQKKTLKSTYEDIIEHFRIIISKVKQKTIEIKQISPNIATNDPGKGKFEIPQNPSFILLRF